MCAESDRKRGIPLMIELRESLDTVNLNLGAMPTSTVRSLSYKQSKARNGAQKVFEFRERDAGACESINSKQSSRASSDGKPQQI
jgi:hypothetical protein